MTLSVPLQHIIDNSLNVQRNNRPASFIGFQEETVVGVVVEEILRQDGTTEGILQDVEVAFPVGITVGVVLPELVPGKPERCGPVQAIGKMVTGGLATGGVASPAAGVHPLLAVTGSVGVDGDQADIAVAQLPAPGVHTFGAAPESYSSGVTKVASKPQYWRCLTTAAAISRVYLYSRKKRKIISRCRKPHTFQGLPEGF